MQAAWKALIDETILAQREGWGQDKRLKYTSYFFSLASEVPSTSLCEALFVQASKIVTPSLAENCQVSAESVDSNDDLFFCLSRLRLINSLIVYQVGPLEAARKACWALNLGDRRTAADIVLFLLQCDVRSDFIIRRFIEQAISYLAAAIEVYPDQHINYTLRHMKTKYPYANA